MCSLVTKVIFYCCILSILAGCTKINNKGTVFSEPVTAKVDVAYSSENTFTILNGFVDHHNGTITDNNTGLMWKKCSEGLDGQDCKSGKAFILPWKRVIKKFNKSNFAGYNDWRIPVIQELASLTRCSNIPLSENKYVYGSGCGNFSKTFKTPAIETAIFPNIPKTYDGSIFWSLSESPLSKDLGYNDQAGILNVQNGSRLSDQKNMKHFVRLVRGKITRPVKLSNRYIDHADGTVTDTKSKLMWKKCSEGVSGVDCSLDRYKKLTWKQAMNIYKKPPIFAGYSDWHLPTIEELRTLVDCSDGTPVSIALQKGCQSQYKTNKYGIRYGMNTFAFPNHLNTYWSSSKTKFNDTAIWTVSFYTGTDNWYKNLGGKSKAAILLVRKPSAK